MIRYPVFVRSSLNLLSLSSSPQTAYPMVSLSEKQQDAIRGIMSRAVESKTVPALFCGVTDQNGELFVHQAGRRVLGDPSSDLLDENAVFWICSQTKLITTIAALQLIEQGKLQLSTPVSDILPEVANPVVVTVVGEDRKPTTTTPATTPLTLGHLLNHTSGMEYNLDGQTLGTFPNSTAHAYGEDEDSSTFFRLNQGSFPGQLLKFEPGTDFAYGLSTDFLGFVIERVSGKSLDQYFKEHIFSPLGITSASFHLTPDLKERLLPLSFRVGENLEKFNDQVKIIPEKTNVNFGGVGLFSSQKDYLALLRHLLQIKGGKAENPILKAASGAASLAKMFGLPEGSVQFGTGLMVTTVDFPGRRKKGTASWAGWACTSYFMDPDIGIAAVFGTQLLPSLGFDPTYEALWLEVEGAIYAGLEK
ncbi:beta-lactamase/transpeptidase-like protein [Mycena alexandri]|uniref:Beta-lactamase/transpeptidase-like protein n=1 Tax=Mycena alexandri TaxID=1745969 RepID=A0AAD6TCQ7_9AGAR|nr:beta-lactamase/transpeptidase-like protein [Mycena alexandri]